MWYEHFLKNVFRLPMSALATVAGKSFNGRFAANIDFPMGYFMLPLLYADVGSLKFPHKLEKFEKNNVVGTIQNLELLTKNG